MRCCFGFSVVHAVFVHVVGTNGQMKESSQNPKLIVLVRVSLFLVKTQQSFVCLFRKNVFLYVCFNYISTCGGLGFMAYTDISKYIYIYLLWCLSFASFLVELLQLIYI